MASENNGKVRLIDERLEPIKQLDGFEKHHRVPSKCSDSDERFVQQLAESELDDDLQEYFAALRKSYGLKRKELSVDGPSEGSGVIDTPFFNYEITVTQSPDAPSKVMWQRMVTDITEPARVFSGPFEDVFGQRFKVLEMVATDDLDLEAIVDHIEDLESESVKVEYDKDLTWCEVKFEDSTTKVMIKGNTIRVISQRECSTQQLLESYLKVQQELLEVLNLGSVLDSPAT